jgi:hypothetical protein
LRAIAAGLDERGIPTPRERRLVGNASGSVAGSWPPFRRRKRGRGVKGKTNDA